MILIVVGTLRVPSLMKKGDKNFTHPTKRLNDALALGRREKHLISFNKMFYTIFQFASQERQNC